MAVRVRLEQLMVQDQLNQMGAEVLETYMAPCTKDLPNNVYCCIKLRDVENNNYTVLLKPTEVLSGEH